MDSTPNKSLFSLFILSLHLMTHLHGAASSQDVKKFMKGYEVHVVNNLPSTPGLFIHCASGNDDLGNHTLNLNEEFTWHFHMNFWQTTKYFCRFRWENRDVAHDVFNYKLSSSCEYDHHQAEGNICYWSVTLDGFYLGNQIPPQNVMKIYDWLP
ncbi:S-protein homolog 5-like [Henckelia pumila]|uniref:S-protein homolog 5-like n=1 Tax=Henckelia pumila TaxID=405737 RepID=UPI003C6DF26F